jgi:hypothetical protein
MARAIRGWWERIQGSTFAFDKSGKLGNHSVRMTGPQSLFPDEGPLLRIKKYVKSELFEIGLHLPLVTGEPRFAGLYLNPPWSQLPSFPDDKVGEARNNRQPHCALAKWAVIAPPEREKLS